MESSGSIHVLHVDDDAPFLELAGTYLERESDALTVTSVTDQEAALDRLESDEIDCVVSDYQMPGMDGLSLFEAVRERSADVPFVLFTGQGSEAIASEALTAGVTEYLQKEGSTDQFVVLANRIENVVAQRRAERTVAETRERFRTLVEETTDAIFVVGPNGEFQYVTPSVGRILGYEPETLEGEIGFDRIHPDDVDDAMAAFQSMLESPEARVSAEFRYEHADGGWVWLECRGRNLLDDPVIDGVVVYTRDVTERKRRERRLQAIFHHSPDAVFIHDGETVLEANPATCEQLGYDREELLGMRLGEFIAAVDARPSADESEPTTAGAVLDQVDREGSATVGGRHRRRDGSEYPVEVNVGTVEWEGEERYMAVARDLTALREREAELDMVRAAIDEAPVGVTISDPDRPDNPLIYANEQFQQLTGYDESDVLGRNCRYLQGERTDPDAVARLRSAIDAAEPVSVELRNYRQDGTEFWNQVDVAPITGDDGTVTNYVGFQRDVTERKRRERRLEALHRATQELLRVETVSEAAELAVTKMDEILGMSISGIWRYDEDRDVLAPLALTEQGRSVVDELPTYTGEGSISWSVFESGEKRVYDDLREVPEVHNPDTEMRSEIVLPLGDHGVMNIGDTEPGSFGESDVRLAELWAATVTLVFTRLDRERRLQERETELERERDRLDEFASVVSHDLRNPLSVADGRVALAREEHDSEHLAVVDRTLDRMESLVDDLLTLSRQGRTVDEVEPVALDAVVADSWKNVATTAASLRVDVSASARADRQRLSQVFENLFRNAIEHGGEDVRIAVGLLEDGEGFYVEDDGPGVPPDDREQVFDMGYSTAAEGVGFGLKIVSDIVAAHGWEIEVTEGADGGARFEIRGVSLDRSG